MGKGTVKKKTQDSAHANEVTQVGGGKRKRRTKEKRKT